MRKMVFFLSVLAFGALPVCSATLAQGERDRALSELHATRKAFLDSISGLSLQQWNFKPAVDRWSVAEVAEHIALSEDRIFGLIAEKIMQSPADADKRKEITVSDADVLRIISDRSQKAQAPEFLQPAHTWKTREELDAHFRGSRDRTLAWVRTTQDDLRVHTMAHPLLKTIDAYQWILLLAAHCDRHTQQIREVMADAKFPTK